MGVAASGHGREPLGRGVSLPVTLGETANRLAAGLWWRDTAVAFLLFYVLLDWAMLSAMLWLFDRRWRVWS